MGGNIDQNDYALNINMIGENMYLLHLCLTGSIYTDRKAIDVKEKKSIFDYWNFNYKFNIPIEQQINHVFLIYKQNKCLNEINSKEVLIVHAKNKDSTIIKDIFTKMEAIKMPHYMPLVLFLLDEFDETIKNNPIIPNKVDFPHINQNKIFTAPFINNEEYILESKTKELNKK